MRFKKIIFILLIIFTAVLLPSCKKDENKGEKLTGKYELETVYVDGEISTSYYITYQIEFKDETTTIHRLQNLNGEDLFLLECGWI